MKNCIRPHYEKLKPLKSGFIENSNFGNNRDPCIYICLFCSLWKVVAELREKNQISSPINWWNTCIACNGHFYHLRPNTAYAWRWLTHCLMLLRLDWYDSLWWSHQLQNMRPIPTLKSKECLTCIEITFQQNWSQKFSCWKLSARLGWIEFYYCSGWFIAMHLLNGCPVKNTFRVAGLGRLSAGCKHGHETFRQARNYNFRDKCIVFGRNLKFSNLTQ